jgi:hypothetical protein
MEGFVPQAGKKIAKNLKIVLTRKAKDPILIQPLGPLPGREAGNQGRL